MSGRLLLLYLLLLFLLLLLLKLTVNVGLDRIQKFSFFLVFNGRLNVVQQRSFLRVKTLRRINAVQVVGVAMVTVAVAVVVGRKQSIDTGRWWWWLLVGHVGILGERRCSRRGRRR